MIRVGDGASTNFWHDKWLTNVSLVVSFHKIYVLDKHILDSFRDRLNVAWDLGNFRRLPRMELSKANGMIPWNWCIIFGCRINLINWLGLVMCLISSLSLQLVLSSILVC